MALNSHKSIVTMFCCLILKACGFCKDNNFNFFYRTCLVVSDSTILYILPDINNKKLKVFENKKMLKFEDKKSFLIMVLKPTVKKINI